LMMLAFANLSQLGSLCTASLSKESYR
jgi:hypothetical protein